MGKGNKDTFGLLPNDVDLLHARHMQQLLAQRLCIPHQQSLRLAFGFQGEKRKCHVRKLVVDHWADDTRRQLPGLIVELFTRLIELLLHLRGRRAIEQ
ncbi:hypothetical protein D3C76_942230 [compost metagenome]